MGGDDEVKLLLCSILNFSIVGCVGECVGKFDGRRYGCVYKVFRFYVMKII